MRLSVITDGISRDLDHALAVMADHGLREAELQYVRTAEGDREVGDLSDGDRRKVREALAAREMRVPCISRHLFAGQVMATARPGDEEHTRHMEALRRCIAFAHELADLSPANEPPLVRIMTGRKEAILFGAHGAEVWNVAHGAWDAQLPLVAPAVDLARREGVRLAVETGNGTMVNSCHTARRLIDDLDAAGVLGVLWDPANNRWCKENPLEGYAAIRDHLLHVHIKDVHADPPRAMLEVRPLGEGELGPHLPAIAQALRADGYKGAVSYESVFHPGNGDFEAGFRGNVERFRELFG